MYSVEGFRLFRNDISQTGTTRPYGATAIYMHIPLAVIEGYPRAQNINGIEFTIIKTDNYPDLAIEIYNLYF